MKNYRGDISSFDLEVIDDVTGQVKDLKFRFSSTASEPM